MSLLPLLLDSGLERPSRFLDQQFGLALDSEDLLAPLILPGGNSPLMRTPLAYIRPWRLGKSRDAGSTLLSDKEKILINLDVQQFAPDEIAVRLRGNNTILIEGKHDEKQDEHGYISRHFLRRYVLPEGHDINNIQSTLSSDGVLSIMAPKLKQTDSDSRPIPIQQTGLPLKIDQKREEKLEKNEEKSE